MLDDISLATFCFLWTGAIRIYDPAMTTHIIINGREITSPVFKLAIAIGIALMAALVAALILFVALPLLGITLALTFASALIVVVAVVAGSFVLAFGAAFIGLLAKALERLSSDSRRR